MDQIWARVIAHHRIVKNETVPFDGSLLDALNALCARMDLPRPMILPKHEREWEQFGQMHFTKDHFVESFPYDKLEIERIGTDERPSRSMDPRNG